ncbi:MAG TPA: DNA-directed RNA polymerase subunit omega [Clostridiales bacterium]|nr:DNA-directed RNA polymerase subunit omega [Clostridiales bacterium]
MIDPPLNEITKKVSNRYILVVEVAKRARQLVDGAPPLVEVDSTNPVTIAIHEVLHDKIKYAQPEMGTE